ncbi:hypothetical protein PPERSA_04497 [Pseudocohnilembus persalinus]|uniref:Uncharacterized protein n=1 Tax=Pseudocohnilembus persalinus TaxID=266149 RepID=A0A0V0QTB2_PSEPJ|nr:hypothetical protein PPERSA_04497 [Pseudocohnilembus persalinus]|eukprot:KRX05460.1 hypothetical protein PPERSA_04497 [Pseudocohnilembus persalinus]
MIIRGNNCFHMAAMRINMSCLRYMLKKLTRNKFENEDDSLKLMKQLLQKKNVEGFSPVDYLVKAFNVIRGQETVTEEEVLAYIYDKDQPPKQVIKQVQLEEIQDDMTNLISQRSKNGIKSSLKRISQLDNNSSKNLNDGSPLQQVNMNGQYGQIQNK